MRFPAPLNFQFSIFNFQSNLKILLLSSILYLLSSAFLTTQPAFASEPTNNQNPYTAPNTDPDVPKNLNTWTQTVMIEVMSALSCQLAGVNPANINQACLGVDPTNGKIGFIEEQTDGAGQSPVPNGTGGAIGVMTHFISSLYNIPIHTGDYVGYLAQNFGIVKSAYAQGTGFEGLKPLIGVWTAFRNIVYLIFTIIFVVIGFAIMFRVKIDPRTVMTIQNQIPKIIVGILLVTFSYAIAGFLIDMMYTTIYLTGNVLTSASNQPASLVTGLVQSDNPFSAANQAIGIETIAWEPSRGVVEFIMPIFDNPAGRVISAIVGYQLFRLIKETSPAKSLIDKISKGLPSALGGIGAVLGSVIPGAGNIVGFAIGKTIGQVATGLIGAGIGAAFGPTIISFLFSSIAFIIIAIAMLWALFRLWFTLILSYIYILIDVVLAPFWIAGGLIPGSPVTFTGWLRHIVSYLVVFPLTIGLFLLGKIFIDAFGKTQTANEFVPPLIANPADTSAIGAIIGLGIVLLTPNVLTMAQKALKSPQLDVGSVGQAIGVGTGLPRIVTTLGQIGLTFQGLKGLPFVSKLPGQKTRTQTAEQTTTAAASASASQG